MFEHHFGLRENPFVAGHHARFVYPSPEHQEALAHLRFGIENREPFVLITGEVGTGKTTAIYDALAEWQTRVIVALITNSALTRNELLEEIALRFGVSLTGGTSKPQVIAQLERLLLAIHQRGDRAILLLDEAQNLERDLLEEIRLLSNLEVSGQKLMQVFLVGQPELEGKLARPELRQLRQRITVHYRLSPLTAEDTERYIHHRISVAGGHALSIFPPAACREVFNLTHGIPREINNVCAQALLNAFVDDARSVSPAQVLAAASDTEFQSVIVRGTEVLPGRVLAETEPMGKVQVVSTPAHETTDEGSDPEEESFDDVGMDAGTPMIPPVAVATPTPPAPQVSAPVIAPPSAPPPPEAATMPVYEPPVVEHTPIEPISIPAIDSWMSARTETRPAVENSFSEPMAATPPSYQPAAERHENAAPVPAPTPPAPAAEPVAPPPAPMPSSIARAAAASEPAWVTPLSPPSRPASRPAETPARSLADDQRAALPPRLKAKLEQAPDEEKSADSNMALRWIVGAGVVAVIAIATIMLVRFGPWATHAPAPDAVVPIEPPTAASALHPEPEAMAPAPETGVVENPSAATSVPLKTPVIASAPKPRIEEPLPVKPATPTPTTASAAATRPRISATAGSVAAGASVPAKGAFAPPIEKPVTPRASFGVAVATFLFEERANTEREKLAASTGLPARVVTASEGGTDVYRLVLGAFPDRNAAERGASDLVRRGLVDEARVVGLPRAAPAKP